MSLWGDFVNHFTNDFPYTDYQKINLDWLLDGMNACIEAVGGFIQQYNPVNKTPSMTQPVGKDADGQLWTAPGGGAVQSVNGRTGDVVLTASDVGAVPAADYQPAAKTSAMTQSVGKDSSGKLWTAPPAVNSVNNKTGAVMLDASDVGAVASADYQPAAKTSAMTQSVGKDNNGKLWTKPGELNNLVILDFMELPAADLYTETATAIAAGKAVALIEEVDDDETDIYYYTSSDTDGLNTIYYFSCVKADTLYWYVLTSNSITKYTQGVQMRADVITQTAPTAITLADNTEYYLANVGNLTLTYPSAGHWECWILLTTANSGTIRITLPSSSYIGNVPTFGNGDTWEISIKDGIVVAGKVASA